MQGRQNRGQSGKSPTGPWWEPGPNSGEGLVCEDEVRRGLWKSQSSGRVLKEGELEEAGQGGRFLRQQVKVPKTNTPGKSRAAKCKSVPMSLGCHVRSFTTWSPPPCRGSSLASLPPPRPPSHSRADWRSHHQSVVSSWSLALVHALGCVAVGKMNRSLL